MKQSSKVPFCNLSLQFYVGAAHTCWQVPAIATTHMRAPTTRLRFALRCRFKYRTIGASALVTLLSSSSPLWLFLPCYSLSLWLLMLLLSLTSCCSSASPVLVQAVLASGCMLFVMAVLSLFVVVGVVVGSFAVLMLLLPELICYLSLQFHAGAVAGHVGDGTNHRHQPNARGKNTAPVGAVLPRQVQSNRCVCVSCRRRHRCCCACHGSRRCCCRCYCCH